MGASEKHDAAWHGTEGLCHWGGSETAACWNVGACGCKVIPRAQPKPTAADVLVHHARDAAHGCISCGSLPIGSSFAQHQADMLAAAGLLATAERDARVAFGAIRPVIEECNALLLDEREARPFPPRYDRAEALRRVRRIAAGELT